MRVVCMCMCLSIYVYIYIYMYLHIYTFISVDGLGPLDDALHELVEDVLLHEQARLAGADLDIYSKTYQSYAHAYMHSHICIQLYAYSIAFIDDKNFNILVLHDMLSTYVCGPRPA